MKLWEPISISNMTLDNRLVMLATHLGYCDEDGIVTERLIEFYRERARHRPGMIIVGGCYTEHLGMSSPTMIGISRDEHIAGLSRLVDVIKSFDVPVAAQLYHAGRYAHSLILGQQAVSASATKCRLTRETSRPLGKEEIDATVSSFGKAASRAKAAGFDSVEIIGSAGYLINQFLAPATNLRDDEYGGSLEFRARFALEVVRSVRNSVGHDFPILYRMSGEDFIPDGLKLEDNKILAPWLREAGVDCFDVTGGWHETKVPQITMNVPRGHYAYLAEGIADVVDVPVVASNRINSISIAERILSRGKAQLIGMSRGFLADPEFPTKAREGRQQSIRPCIACNQGCLDRVFMMEPVTCAINPLTGYETDRSLGFQCPGRIAIIGGGPAGMETSRVLASRGFNVTLYEENKRLGGLLNLAAKIPGRGEFAAYVSHMEHELRELGVNVVLNTLVNAKTLIDENYDRIICATGTIAGAPPVDGVESSHVTTAYDVLSLDLDDLGDVIVIGGRALGCYTALNLASRADSVQIFDSDETIGVDLGRTTRWVILQGLKARAVKVYTEARVVEIESKYIIVLQDGAYHHVKAKTIVLATEPQPRDRLLLQLQKRGIPFDSVGSVVKTMNLLDVVHGAFNLANSINT
ncbi:MAG: FAD-dependent oxidoreductase [Candidatus Thorarchaeota archaeon]|nr:FAD-dependent oxidoreductase [Candidatus Thorarchaeota archaeon]